MDPNFERVAAAVSANGATLRGLTPLYGGACQDIFRAEVALSTGTVALALRSDAKTSLPGSLRRRAEFRVVEAAVAAGVRTPAARWLTADLLRPSSDAYFLDWAPGEAFGRRVVRNPELEAARAKLPVELGATLAQLHRVTPSTGDLGLPPPPKGPAATALETLAAMLDTQPSPHPAIEYGLGWLRERLPAKEEVVLVHGDFRTGNFLVTPDGLSAVLDWEFSHWGSPYEDLAWISVRDWRFGQLDLPIGGFAKRQPFYDAYCNASGRTLEPEQLLFWEVFGNLRWAVGSAAQGERYLTGGDKDLELIAIARRAVEMEFEALRLMRRGKV